MSDSGDRPVFSGLKEKITNAFALLLTAQNTGLVPDNYDGFETGDWRNFRPHYVGKSTEWIRPQISINDSDPISGNYSLQWRGSDKEHEWIMVSNAFYLELPIEVTMDFRMNALDSDWSIGLFLMETYKRYTGIRLIPENRGWMTALLHDLTESGTSIEYADEQLYRLSVKRTGPDAVGAKITAVESGQVLVELDGFSSITPEALGIYVLTGAGSKAILDFDNISIDAAPYRLKSGVWERSPHFVVLPRQPDLEQGQGNWVGAQSTMKKDGRYLMWYRMRDNQERGRGYGFAESTDGIHWKKYDNNPVFTYDPDLYSSSEKISVIHVDGLYRAWFAVNAPGTWYIAHATSKDGKHWDQHGLVIEDTYTKDAVALYVDKTYYLYSIRDNDKVGIHTSVNGVEWELQNTIPMGVHRHIAATYVDRTGEFYLYASGGFAGVSQAVSTDGRRFGPFKQVMEASKVGLDDWSDAGVTYLSFLTDKHGKINDNRELPVYYQARNTWNNNSPGWHYHGSERVVLAGYYDGFYIGVDTTVLPAGGYKYHRFPFGVPKAKSLDIHASREIEIHLKSWQPDARVLGEGQLRVPSSISGHSGQAHTQVQWNIYNLKPGVTYKLELDHQQIAGEQADDQGRVLFTAITSGKNDLISFQINRILNQNN